MWEFPVSTAESEHHIWVYYFSSVLWNCLMVPLHLEYSREGLEGRGGKKLNSTGQVEEILVGNSREIALCLGGSDIFSMRYCTWFLQSLLLSFPHTLVVDIFAFALRSLNLNTTVHPYVYRNVKATGRKMKEKFRDTCGCMCVGSVHRTPSLDLCNIIYCSGVSEERDKLGPLVHNH